MEKHDKPKHFSRSNHQGDKKPYGRGDNPRNKSFDKPRGGKSFDDSRPNARANDKDKDLPPLPNELAWRAAALRSVIAVLADNKRLDNALTIFGANLDSRAHRQCHALAAACLRHRTSLDDAIDKHMEKPFDETSREKGLLRLGLAQIMLLDSVPDHAAVATTVDLAKALKLLRATKLINAVLRTLIEQKQDIVIEAKDTIPSWMVDILKKDYADLAPSLMEAMVGRAPLDVRLRPCDKAIKDVVIKELTEKEGKPLDFTRDGWRLPVDTRPNDLTHLSSGEVYVQDGAAQLPANLILDQLLPEGPVLDVCAAPGGKTLQLLDYMPTINPVVALDVQAKRLKTLQYNLKLRGHFAKVLQADARQLPFDNKSAAAVLLDAPCTATGTSRRHIETLQRRSLGDLENLQRIQKQLLREAARVVKPGGLLVYATCSLFKAEGEEQIKNFIKSHPHFVRVALPESTQAWQTKDGDIRTTPLDGLDGFFMSVLRVQG